MKILGKAKQIERHLRTSIERGRWKPGEAIPPERELCADLGVSRVALRDALMALTNDGLLIRRQGSGTFVAESVGQRQVSMLCTLDDLMSGQRFFTRAVIEELKQRAEDHGYKGMLGVGQGKTGKDVIDSVSALDPTHAQNMAGAILITRMPPVVHDHLEKLNIPFVTVDVNLKTSDHEILLDYSAMVNLGARVLREAGQEDFAIMAFGDSSLEHESPLSIIESSQDACLSAVNNDTKRIILVPVDHPELAGSIFANWWQRTDRPNALFFTDDVLCDMSCQTISKLGISVPDDLMFISESSTANRFHFAKKIACLEFSVPQLADATWDLLDDLIHGRLPSKPVRRIQPVYRPGETL